MASVSNEQLNTEEEVPDVFQRPRCLVSCVEDGKLVVEEETLQLFEGLHAKCHVVAVVGPSRSGKSYLLNRVARYSSELIKLKNTKRGGVLSWILSPKKTPADEQPQIEFALDHSLVSQKKGIWIWCRPHPTLDDHVLVLLDCDGIGDPVRADSQYDQKILSLATMLSHTLMYNVKGTLDVDSIEKLVFCSRISRRIKRSTQNSEAANNGPSQTSKLVICVRDFSLLLPNDGLEPPTADDFLATCLKLRREVEAEDAVFNQPRECIRQQFSERHVFMFDRPGERNLLLKLDEVPDNRLSKDFLQDVGRCCCDVLEVDGKKPDELNLSTSEDLTAKLRMYVTAVENDDFPTLSDTMSSLTSFWNDRALQHAVHAFRQQMENIELPVFRSRELQERKEQLKIDCLGTLQNFVEYDNDNTIASRAEREMDCIAKKVEDRNSRLVQEKCSKALQEMFEPIFYNIQQGKFKVTGGYAEFQKDVNEMIQRFMEDHSYVDQEERRAVLDQFKSTSLNKEGERIMVEDRKQLEVDHETALLIKDEESYKQRQETHDLFIRQIEDQQRRHDHEMSDMSRKRKRDDDDDGSPNFFKRIFR